MLHATSVCNYRLPNHRLFRCSGEVKMPRRVKPLNAKQVAAWRPDPIRTLELPDGALPGLWVRLTPSGDISWSLNVRVHGVRRRIAVGRKLGLAEARRRAEALRVEIASG